IRNNGGGLLNWTASVTYAKGTGWLRLETTSGQNNGNIRIFADPSKLAAGTYQAAVSIDSGAAGIETVPVTLTVAAAPPVMPPTPAVQVTDVINAATYDITPLVPGSLGTLKGSHLAGKNVAVSLDGNAAAL